jgi:transcriptional regulator with XRE-family HTH domain
MRLNKDRNLIFGSKIIELRQQNHMSQRDLANKLGFDRASIYAWERKGKEPSYATLIKLSKLFDVSIDYLLGNEDFY